MGRFTNYLRESFPRTGRLLTEDGGYWNQADWGYFNERYSLIYQAVRNGAAVMSVRAAGVNTSPFYIGLDVPAGRRLILFNRELAITQGDYNIDVVTAENGFTGGTIGPKETLKTGATPTVQSNYYAGVTPDGALTERYLGLVDTGTEIGAGRSGGASGVDSVIQIYTGQPMIRIERLSTDPYRVVVRIIVWEEDDV